MKKAILFKYSPIIIPKITPIVATQNGLIFKPFYNAPINYINLKPE